MLQQAAPSTQQAPHPLSAHATRTCCRLTAEDWNAWIHALTGNTPDPAAPKPAKTAGAPYTGPKAKAKIAVWRYDDPHRSHNGGTWTTGKVVDEWDGVLGDPNHVPVTS